MIKNKNIITKYIFLILVIFRFTPMQPMEKSIEEVPEYITPPNEDIPPEILPYWLQFKESEDDAKNKVIACALLGKFEAIEELLLKIKTCQTFIDLALMQYDMAIFIAKRITVNDWDDLFLAERRDIDLSMGKEDDHLYLRYVRNNGFRQVWLDLRPRAKILYESFLDKAADLSEEEFIRVKKVFLSRLLVNILITLQKRLGQESFRIKQKKLVSYIDVIYNFLEDLAYVKPYADFKGLKTIHGAKFLSHNFKILYELVRLVTLKEKIHPFIFSCYYANEKSSLLGLEAIKVKCGQEN